VCISILHAGDDPTHYEKVGLDRCRSCLHTHRLTTSYRCVHCLRPKSDGLQCSPLKRSSFRSCPCLPVRLTTYYYYYHPYSLAQFMQLISLEYETLFP
jgi:hypothetical protein